MAEILIDGEVVLYGLVGDVGFFNSDGGFSARDVQAALASVGRSNDVVIRINSPGGVGNEGIAIFNALKGHRGRVDVYVDAIAGSAASLIAMAGDSVFMQTGSYMMIHDPAMFTAGTAADHEKSMEGLETLAASMADIYAERTQRSTKDIRREMAAETWLTAQQAIDKGYADQKVLNPATDPVAFNYRLFQHAPERMVALADARGWSVPSTGKRHTAKHKSAVPTPRQLQESPMANETAGGTQPVLNTQPQPAAPAPAAPAPAAPAPVVAPQVTAHVDLEAERRRAYEDGVAYATEVRQLCALAGQDKLADEFVEKRSGVADVRKALLAQRAEADASRQVTSFVLPGAGTASAKLPDNLNPEAVMKRHLGLTR